MLTQSEKTVIQEGWAQVMKRKEELAMDIILKLFEEQPHYQELFKDFKGKSQEELRKLPQLELHAMLIVTSLDGAIQKLDDQQKCAESLEDIGAKHRGRGVTANHFENLNKVLIIVLGQHLGKDFLDNKGTWEKLLTGIVPVIDRGL